MDGDGEKALKQFLNFTLIRHSFSGVVPMNYNNIVWEYPALYKPSGKIKKVKEPRPDCSIDSPAGVGDIAGPSSLRPGDLSSIHLPLCIIKGMVTAFSTFRQFVATPEGDFGLSSIGYSYYVASVESLALPVECRRMR